MFGRQGLVWFLVGAYIWSFIATLQYRSRRSLQDQVLHNCKQRVNKQLLSVEVPLWLSDYDSVSNWQLLLLFCDQLLSFTMAVVVAVSMATELRPALS